MGYHCLPYPGLRPFHSDEADIFFGREAQRGRAMPDANVRQIKIMISSTRADLAQYREEASRIIKKVAAEKEKQLQLVEVSMEKETQDGGR